MRAVAVSWEGGPLRTLQHHHLSANIPTFQLSLKGTMADMYIYIYIYLRKREGGEGIGGFTHLYPPVSSPLPSPLLSFKSMRPTLFRRPHFDGSSLTCPCNVACRLRLAACHFQCPQSGQLAVFSVQNVYQMGSRRPLESTWRGGALSRPVLQAKPWPFWSENGSDFDEKLIRNQTHTISETKFELRPIFDCLLLIF